MPGKTLTWTLALAAAAWAQVGAPDASWGADRLAAAMRGKDAAVAVEAAKALGELKDDAAAFDALASAVTDAKLDATVRSAALRALEKRGDARATTCLVATLGDERLGSAAAEALARYPSPELTKQLGQIAAGDKKAKRRADAVYALGRLHDASAFQPLLATMRDKDAEVRARACLAVAAYNDQKAVEPLLVNLNTDKDWRGRLAAAQALGLVRDERSVKPLCERLEDDRAEVRGAAACSLAAIGDVRAMDPLRAGVAKEKNDAARAAMTAALEKIKADILKGVKIK